MHIHYWKKGGKQTACSVYIFKQILNSLKTTTTSTTARLFKHVLVHLSALMVLRNVSTDFILLKY